MPLRAFSVFVDDILVLNHLLDTMVLMPLRAFSVFVEFPFASSYWGQIVRLNALTGIQCIRRR